MEDRLLLYEDAKRRQVMLGILLNDVYHNILRMRLTGNVDDMPSIRLVVFADNVAVVATGHTTALLEEAMNLVLTVVAK